MTRKQLKLLRLYTGLTQAEFARGVGMAPGTIAKMEADLMPISTANRAKILRHYDLLDEGFLAFCERMKV
ncbi:helix-turn-helix domain-containing protein [Mesobacillus maritimus]|uniref:helix-turn-helix domain-containing protein n=1 Tax=Mesobacillus maritimus TaxID=1643336 RepID=UPI00203EBC51|nr:helix-turn-helix transcriptional regulator [Mesobacillus maritimus]MCM3668013.1 helix-turn-helix domain-containing protein [Mesobacillus maritimus]